MPVEFGLKVCVPEDQYGSILHHRVMEHETDDQVAIPMVELKRSLGRQRNFFVSTGGFTANDGKIRPKVVKN